MFCVREIKTQVRTHTWGRIFVLIPSECSETVVLHWLRRKSTLYWISNTTSFLCSSTIHTLTLFFLREPGRAVLREKGWWCRENLAKVIQGGINWRETATLVLYSWCLWCPCSLLSDVAWLEWVSLSLPSSQQLIKCIMSHCQGTNSDCGGCCGERVFHPSEREQLLLLGCAIWWLLHRLRMFVMASHNNAVVNNWFPFPAAKTLGSKIHSPAQLHCQDNKKVSFFLKDPPHYHVRLCRLREVWSATVPHTKAEGRGDSRAEPTTSEWWCWMRHFGGQGSNSVAFHCSQLGTAHGPSSDGKWGPTAPDVLSRGWCRSCLRVSGEVIQHWISCSPMENGTRKCQMQPQSFIRSWSSFFWADIAPFQWLLWKTMRL